MYLICGPARLCGGVEIPGSKSHTIRAVAAASLAAGQSVITAPLASADTLAAVDAYRAMGAEIQLEGDTWRVCGFAGRPRTPDNVIDVKNSGTTLRIATGTASLLEKGAAIFTGDYQIRRRPIGPLAQSLTDLGANISATRDNGCAPLIVRGRLRGGQTTIEAVTSQYVTSLLMCTPLADGDSLINVPVLNEQPYVHVTLGWLTRCGIEVERRELEWFRVRGGQQYQPIQVRVPADFSSATFFLAAGVLGENEVVVRGLDMADTQGDKAVIDYLRQMGAEIEFTAEGIRIRPGELVGCELDMNATPDALPMMAVVGCFARGTTSLVNVPQARLKETDRIAVMCRELSKMGATIRERPDGLLIERSQLHGADVDGHDDHRVVMALAVAGTAGKGTTRISTAEAMQVTFPAFVASMNGLGADLKLME